MSGIVEGRRWVQERLRYLHGLLADDPPEEQRRAIEAEIEALGREHKSWWSRLLPHRTDT